MPFALIVAGLGMTLGNVVGGRLADRGPLRAIFLCFGAFAVSLVVLGLTGHVAGRPAHRGVPGRRDRPRHSSPASRPGLMDVAGDSQTLAAAVNHSALNIGNSLGALLGGAVIAAGFGYLAPDLGRAAALHPGRRRSPSGARSLSRRAQLTRDAQRDSADGVYVALSRTD